MVKGSTVISWPCWTFKSGEKGTVSSSCSASERKQYEERKVKAVPVEHPDVSHVLGQQYMGGSVPGKYLYDV